MCFDDGLRKIAKVKSKAENRFIQGKYRLIKLIFTLFFTIFIIFALIFTVFDIIWF